MNEADDSAVYSGHPKVDQSGGGEARWIEVIAAGEPTSSLLVVTGVQRVLGWSSRCSNLLVDRFSLLSGGQSG